MRHPSPHLSSSRTWALHNRFESVQAAASRQATPPVASPQAPPPPPSAAPCGSSMSRRTGSAPAAAIWRCVSSQLQAMLL